ncbi:speckle-type POZ protein B [Trichonephila inaurata madagascariensis]|uniref:Speckle-type POZ protein B n=1 Tax=Trichonephila inaurata madagascariensis TaxID=2747483 RepID=A0A8X7CM32_9ARAC|nr:speckle-type POZ protein B [Trichonephila inaurata madagascariensis]
MADNYCNRLAPFTYIWAIENFPAFLSPFPILSPPFIVDCYRKSHWRLGIAESDYHIRCFVKRQDNDDGPETDHLSSQISLLDTEGFPLIAGKIERSFQKGDTFEIHNFALIADVFGTRKDEFLSNDTLTFRFRSFTMHGDIIRINMCFARTRLDIQRRSFIWTIGDFGSFGVGESVARSLVVTENKNLFVTLQLTEEGNVKIQFASNVAVQFNFRISILDVTGKSATHVNGKSKMYDPTHFNLTEKAYLEANRGLLLPVGILTLRFELILGTGIAHEEIESYRFPP